MVVVGLQQQWGYDQCMLQEDVHHNVVVNGRAIPHVPAAGTGFGEFQHGDVRAGWDGVGCCTDPAEGAYCS